MTHEDLKLAMERIIKIGIALSSERDLEVLLEMIVEEARRFTGADGGTLFLVDAEAQVLNWAIVQNETMDIRFGGKGKSAMNPEHFKPISLVDEQGEPAISNVASSVVHTGDAVRIDDVYDEHDEYDFEGPLRFDAQTGYRTLSMMVIPLKHFEGGVIGVLQLINARDPHSGEVVAFDEHHIETTTALASQAAVAVKNALLFSDLERQFEAFIQVIASAIDEKSPYTAGHVKRVVDVAMRIARAVHGAEDGPYASVSFSEDEFKALHIASWMHDVGKIATPEYVVDKATKLQTIFDRLSLVEERFAHIKTMCQRDALADKLALLTQSSDAQVDVSVELARIERELEERLSELDREVAFIKQCNQGVEFMDDGKLEYLQAIFDSPYMGSDGEAVFKLTEDELLNLQIRKGTLTRDEIDIIRDHARVSYAMLSKLPFSRQLKDVPEIAAGHHEKLNGKGYPRGLTAEQLSLPARILAVADIFEALTAKDRPYKKPSPLSMVNRILGFMVKDGELDAELVEFAKQSGVFDAYAQDEVSEVQRDLVFAQN